MENVYGLFQLFASRRNRGREDILLSRRFESRFTKYGANPAHHASDGCT